MAAVPITIQTRTRSSRSRPATAQTSRQAASGDSGRGPRQDRERERERDRDKDRDKKGHAHSSSAGSASAAGASSVAGSLPNRAKSPTASRPSTPSALSVALRPAESWNTALSSSVASSPASGSHPMPLLDISSPPSNRQVTDTQLLSQSTSFTPPPPTATPAPPPHTAAATYQPSTAAQALLDDVRARRESKPQVFQSPFPDLDRTLAALNDNDFSFSFNLDPKLVPKSTNASTGQPGRASPGFKGSFDPFSQSSSPFGRPPPSSQSLPPPPGLVPRPSAPTSDQPPSSASTSLGGKISYSGSFDPFSEAPSRGTPSTAFASLAEDETARRASRFGFAQKRTSDAGSSRFGGSAAGSPLAGTDLLPQTPLYATSDVLSPAPSNSQQMPQWTYQAQQDFGPPPGISPLQFQTNAFRGQHPNFNGVNGMGNFSPFGNSTESALKEMLNIGRNHAQNRRGGVDVFL